MNSIRPVSIILLAHRNSETLKEALVAAEANSRSNDELILVLNLPSPEVLEISKKLSKRWKILEEESLGPQHARNKGVSGAQHDFVVFLDDDIQLTIGWIEGMLSRFTSPWIAAGQGSIKFEKRNELLWNYLKFSHLLHVKAFNQKNGFKGNLDTAAIMIKKSWLKSVDGFHPDLRMCEDTELSIKLHLHGAEIFFFPQIQVNQIYSKSERLYSVFRKTFKAGQYLIHLRKIHNYPEMDYFALFSGRFKDLKKFYLRNMIFMMMDILKSLVLELGMNPYRHEIDRTKRIGIISNNVKKKSVEAMNDLNTDFFSK